MGTVTGLAQIWKNPLFIKGVRTRLRARHLVVWGTMTLVVAAFLFLIVYLTGTERRLVEPDVAAKATLIPLLILQGILLMLLGTGSVATGVALERDNGMLDFHRMTPMAVGQKLAGCLFGLPVREYALFGLTLPFVGLAVALGGIPALKILHLYVVFFSAVILYHLTGFVSGLVAAKPRRASWIAQAAVVTLYLLLPRLSNLGLTFFSFLTIVPAFRSIVADELELGRRPMRQVAEAAGLTSEGGVPFFSTTVDPTAYTLLLQGLLSATFLVVVHRKWRREGRQAFSKPHAVLLFAALQVLVAGSLWPYLGGERELQALRSLGRWVRTVPTALILLTASTILSALGAALLLHIVTPARHAMRAGLRRARKRGEGRVGALDDASSSAWAAAAIAILAAGGSAILAHRVPGAGAAGWAAAVPAAILAAVALHVQAAREAWAPRWFGLFTFLLWLAPFFVFLVITAAWGMSRTAAYLSAPSPITALYFAVDAFVTAAGTASPARPGAVESAPVAATALAIHATLAVALVAARIRGAGQLRREAAGEASPA